MQSPTSGDPTKNESVIEGMLYDGEEILGTVDVGEASVAVTTHRLMSYAPNPDSDTKDFDHAELPNINNVGVKTEGNKTNFMRGARIGVYGLVFLIGGVFLSVTGVLNIGSMINNTPNVESVGGVIGMVNKMTALISLIDELLIFAGLIFILASIALFAVYYRSREEKLYIDVSGREPIKIPVSGVTQERRLENEIRDLVRKAHS